MSGQEIIIIEYVRLRITFPEESNEGARKDRGFVFAEDGSGYFIQAFGNQGHFPRCVGLQYLFRLVQQPGVHVPAAELIADAGTEHLPRPADDTFEPVLDREARIAEIENELARDGSDELLLREREFIMRELKVSTGLNGQDRNADRTRHRLRARVWRGIHRACDTLEQAEPTMASLAEHFKSTVSSSNAAFLYGPATPPLWVCTA